MSTAALSLSPERIRQLVARYGSPLLAISPRLAVEQYRAISEALPGVEPHYALKPLPEAAILRALAAAGARFDVCSSGEIAILQELGITGERCIHTHPIKRPADIAAAVDFGCPTLVFDNPYELDKIEPFKDRCRLLLRLSFRSSEAVVDLSYKFGCAPDDALELLRLAHARGFDLQGLCFHVGSQAAYAYKYLEAIAFCRQVVSHAALDGIELDTIDIGGGFPVSYTEQVAPINEFCRPIIEELGRSFGGMRLIAEPGRFIAAPAGLLIASVMGKSERGGSMWYYLDDGLYGSWSGKLYDHCNYLVSPLSLLEGDDRPRRPSILAGPTCDSVDVIYEGLMLPELEPGDLVVSPMMGAYSLASATDFNRFPRARVIDVDQEAD